jgi:PAS domain S-box-containing protein
MTSASITKKQLLLENDDLRSRLSECEDTLDAIRTGAVDALVVSTGQGEKVFSLQSIDYSYRVMVENMNEGTVTLDTKGVIVFANKAFSDLAGREMTAIVGTRFNDYLPSSLHIQFDSFVNKCIVGSCREEFSLTCCNSDPTPVLISGTIFEIAGKQNFCLLVRDLSDRKEAERKLRNAYEEVEKKVLARTAELKESEERFRTMVNAIPQLAWVAHKDGYIYWYNQRWFEYTGTTPSQMEGWGWQSVHDPVVLPSVMVKWKNSIARGEPFGMEFPLRGADGVFRLFLTRVMPLKNSDGEVMLWFGTNTDIAERKHLEDKLAQQVKELAAANKELESFSYSISHDLRAPLRAMKGFCNILLEDYNEKLDTQGQEYLRRITSSSDKMSELIDDILNLSKISRQEVISEEIDLSAIADAVVAMLRQDDPANTVEVDIARDLKTRGDSHLMSIALSNLIGNAWKYSSKTPGAKIEFGSAEKEGQKIYYIRDNGAGFNMNYADKLFEPFRRLHSDREFSGTGIGLAIVKRVIEKHKGAVWAESETGKGATFYFTLSYYKDK